MRHKYVEERFNRYIVCGEHSNSGSDPFVDIGDSENMTITTMPKEDAEVIIKDRDRVIDMLCELALAFSEADNEAFKKVWYKE